MRPIQSIRPIRSIHLACGLALLCAVAWLLLVPGTHAQDHGPPPGAVTAAADWSVAALRKRHPDPDAKAPSTSFIGNSDCKECHEDRWKSLGTSFHAALLSTKESQSRGCESCHGPGEEHWMEGGEAPIRHPAKASPEISNAACLQCHFEVLSDPVRGHRAWVFPDGPDQPASAQRCVHCHSVHIDAKGPAYDAAIGPFTSRKALAQHASPVAGATCIGCHPGFHPQMARSGHASLITSEEACGSCHGNGTLHVASGGDRTKILNPEHLPAREINATCNACHVRGESVQRWTCSEHAREGVSCIVCHDANARRGRTLRGPEFELCGSCHTDVKAKFRLPNSHRVEEGRVLCSDCHDPHGNRARVRDQDVKLRSCAKCHADKTGPFLHDHGVKRSEGCVMCHDPHGSVNRRMLTHAQIKPMCIQCHPETPHNLRERRWDNCIACHTEIHGSDLDRIFRR